MPIPFWRPAPAPQQPFKGQLFPYEYANPLSRFMYHWAGPILKVGYSRPLVEDDLYELPPTLNARILADKIEAEFAKRLPPSRRPPGYRPLIDLGGEDHLDAETSPLLGEQPVERSDGLDPAVVKKFGKRTARRVAAGDIAVEGGQVYDMTLWRAMYKTIFWKFWRQIMINSAGQYLRVTSPLITRQILWEITTTHALHQAQRLGLATQDLPRPHPLWFGIALSVLLFFWQSIGSLCLYWTAATGSLMAVNLRSALIDLISRKSMRLSPKSRLEYPNGKLTTLVSTDTSTLENELTTAFALLAQPLQVLIGVCLLLWVLGPVSFVGLTVLALSGPSQAFLFSRIRKIRIQQEEAIDRRSRLLTEIIANIRAVKVYAWESIFGKKIAQLRAQEIVHLRRYALVRATITSFAKFNPIAAAISTFIAYSWLGNPLDPLRVFTALHLFNALQRPMTGLPSAYGAVIVMSVAMKRIGKMLAAEEIQHKFIVDPKAEAAIDVRGDFQFEEIPLHMQAQSSDEEQTSALAPVHETPSQPFALRDIALTIPDGALVCVVGRVGTGKSALLSGLISEVRQTKGHVIFNGPVSYVPQQAWVQSGSVRENLTFSTVDDEVDLKRVNEVIDACALRPDIDNWVEGDLTKIGERGITLSGGQRQRICLARAAYSNAKIVLLDDPLSAVDAHVGHHLLANCILDGPLADRTRILVTHNLEVLPSADLILVMDRDDNGDGRIVQQGSYKDLVNSEGIFKVLIHDFGSVSHREGSGTTSPGESEDESESKGKGAPAANAGKHESGKQDTKFMIEEERKVGTIPWSCYLFYMRSVKSWFIVGGLLLAFVLEQGASVSISWWLSVWSANHFRLTTNQYMAVYGLLGAVFAVMMVVTFFGTFYAATRSSVTMFNGAWNGVMRTSVGWHDRTPMGRITNRLTKDVSNLDDTLAGRLYYFLEFNLFVIGGLCLVAYTYPVLASIFIPIALFDYLCLMFYRETAREIKRLDSNLRSHIYTSFSEQLSGMTVIRAFGRQGTYERRLQDTIYSENRAHLLISFFTSRWIGSRMELSAQAIVMMVALFGVVYAADVDAARFGAVLTYIIASTSTISSIVNAAANLEVDMNNVERIKHYNELEPEAAAVLPSDPPATWPSKGELSFSDVCLRYRLELPMILKNVSFSVKPGEKVGIIGRTGAGKSSLAQALFRTVEICGGNIIVDGVNLASIGLDTLRSRLGIIPQDAFLFGGSVRDNLDPTGEHTDQELNDALSLIHHSASASSSVREKFILDAQVQDGGANFSAGERQLVALMRALVRNCKVLLLDEATSSVDPETDALIQRIIQTSFADVTLISIAHRLQTVAYYDRILVMDQGEVAEFDTPLALFDQRDSIFRSLCDKKQLGRADLVKIREDAAMARRGHSAPTDLLD